MSRLAEMRFFDLAAYSNGFVDKLETQWLSL